MKVLSNNMSRKLTLSFYRRGFIVSLVHTLYIYSLVLHIRNLLSSATAYSKLLASLNIIRYKEKLSLLTVDLDTVFCIPRNYFELT